MTCNTCNDWGSITVSYSWGQRGRIPCPNCRPVPHQVALGGEQGDSEDEVELYRLRRRVAELEADLVAIRGGKA